MSRMDRIRVHHPGYPVNPVRTFSEEEIRHPKRQRAKLTTSVQALLRVRLKLVYSSEGQANISSTAANVFLSRPVKCGDLFASDLGVHTEVGNTAIRVENLSKRYRLGQSVARYGTLRDTLADSVRASFNWLQGKRQAQHCEHANEIWALRDVSFEVNWGDAVGVIGRNGAGKSTLLRILSRITEPTRGRAFMHARAASLLEVGTGFHPELTGRENIYFNGAILGMRRAEIARKFDEIVSFAEIEKFVDTPVKHYSSGMYVRLAFSVAAHLDADILLIDEVLAVGDVNFQKKCLERTSQMAKQGRTVMLVSHSMPTIANSCNVALYLKQGEMVRYGDVGTVVSLYMQDSVGAHMLSRDVSTLQRMPGLGDSLRLESVRVVLRKEALYYNDPLEIEVVARAKSAISGLVFGIGVSNGFGVRLLSAESDEDPIELASGERVRVNITIPMPYLPPGSYALEAGARSGPRFMLDYLPEVILFEIAPRFNEVHISDRPEIGLRPLTTWSFDRRS